MHCRCSLITSVLTYCTIQIGQYYIVFIFLQSIYEQATLKQAQKIVRDDTHVLHEMFVLMPSGRRYREPKWRYVRFKNSFVPASTKMLNDALKHQ